MNVSDHLIAKTVLCVSKGRNFSSSVPKLLKNDLESTILADFPPFQALKTFS